MKYWIPLCGLDVGTKIFIKSMARSTIMATYFQCFSDLEVIGKTPFVFGTHFGAFPVIIWSQGSLCYHAIISMW